MGTVPFGRFSLIDVHGEHSGAVVIAPEHILLYRPPSNAIHDLSYLVVWSAPRTEAVMRELRTLVATDQAAVDATTPELKLVLQAIEPKATAIFRRGGHCSRLFARRQLKAALQAADAVAPRRQAS
jgi:hypothetical protein